MSNELVVGPQSQVPALAMDEAELIEVLRSSLYPGASDSSIKMVVAWCRASGKDPIKRPVHIVPMRVKKAGAGKEEERYEYRDVIMEGIGSLRTDAQRTGQFAGMKAAVFGPDKTMKLGPKEYTFPEWCELTVLRLVAGGHVAEFSSGRVRWLETYATKKWDSVEPNAMWAKRPYGQIEKCAEALALRRGFPEIGSQPTETEMRGKTIGDDDDDAVVIDGGEIKMPKPKVVGAESPRTGTENAAAERGRESPTGQGVEDPAPPATAGVVEDGGQKADQSAAVSVGAVAFLRKKIVAAGLDFDDVLKKHGLENGEPISPLQFKAIKATLAD